MDCPCCGRPMAEHDRIEAGSGHRTLSRGTYLWTVYRCAWCAGDSGEEGAPTEPCTCEAIYNDGPDDPKGYGCAL